MSYAATTDFLALLRQTAGGVRTECMPGLDYVMAALARAGVFSLQVGQTAPTTNLSTTVWLKTALSGSWTTEGTVLLYNTSTQEYEPATPVLWSSLLLASAVPPSLVQEITDPGVDPVPILPGAGIVRVNQTVGAPVTLVMPLSSDKVGPVLITDWKGDAGTNNIRVNLTGANVFPGALAFWTIAADAGSIFLRPVPGGYAL